MGNWLSERLTQRNVLFATGLCYVAIAGLSLVPEAWRPHAFGMSDTVEHLVAYTIVGFLTAMVMRASIATPLLFAMIAAYAGILEIGQMLVPCRQASLLDFGSSALGAALGIWIARSVRAQAS